MSRWTASQTTTLALCCVALFTTGGQAGRAETPAADLVVAADGSGDFSSIQKALDSVARGRRERTVILVKDGVYREKIRIEASCVTLRGQGRKGTRIEFPQLLVEYDRATDRIGQAVINVEADDVVIENLTAANTADVDGKRPASLFGRHAFTVFGRGDRTVLLDCDLLSEGADTVALWQGRTGRYYHARCHFRGGVDFVCPRGWCYVTDCTFFETRRSAAIWHDGSRVRDQKLVIRNSSFDGVEGWWLGRHHRDAQFFLLDCTFSKSMADRPLALYRYNDAEKDRRIAAAIRWGERCYYHNCHREGGDYPWHRDNLATAEGSPRPDEVTASWTFGGSWDPESNRGPVVTGVETDGNDIRLTFSEEVTVKGKPRLRGSSGPEAVYSGGSGSPVLTFRAPQAVSGPLSLATGGGTILASIASVQVREADSKLPTSR